MPSNDRKARTWILADEDTRQIRFDCILSETHESTSIVTQHPVEIGAAITDHVRPEADRLTLEVFVTNTPIVIDDLKGRGETGVPLEIGTIPVYEPPIEPTPGSVFRLAGGALGAIAGAIFGAPATPKFHTLIFADLFDAVREVYEELQDLQKNAIVCRVVTPIREYDDMIIERVSVPRKEGSGSSASFEIDLMQIKLVSSGTVDAPITALPSGQPMQKKGAQATEDVKPEDRVSMLKKLKDAVSGGDVDVLQKVLTGG